MNIKKERIELDPIILKENERVLLIYVLYKILIIMLPFIFLGNIWVFSLIHKHGFEIILASSSVFQIAINMKFIKEIISGVLGSEGNE